MKFHALILTVVCGANVFAAEPMTPPLPPSPIAEFRDWLKKSPDEWHVALARRSEKSRKILEEKLQEYSALPEKERQRRLDAMELRWYLRPLMQVPKEKRAEALKRVPVLWQPMVDIRLKQWDQMPLELQKEALDHELMVQYLSSPAQEQELVLRTLSTEERKRLDDRIGRWKILPAVEKQRMDERVGQFFNMEPEKQKQTLDDFSQAEREKMQATLEAFRGLNSHQREVCINSFGKFANMSPEEQMAFLKNAERWQAMSQKDRDLWRKVVQIAPPLPPLPAPKPPMPGGQ